MKLLVHVHGYPPVLNAGAEWMMHSICRDMIRRGHEVQVICVGAGRTGDFQGVMVHVNPSESRQRQLYEWADVVFTHLDRTRDAMRLSQAVGRPLVHVVHNDTQLAAHEVSPKHADLVVFNSKWVQEAASWSGRQMVLYPPVAADEYRVTPGDAITLINLTEQKGAPLFYDLARRMPDQQFLGVRGGYGQQIVPDILPSNVRILPNTPDIRDVYRQTKVLLMPSSYESWGRVAIEATASGIPTVAHPTPGLREALGPAGLFADRGDPEAWVAILQSLEHQGTYDRQSRLSLVRSRELDPTRQLDELEHALQVLIEPPVRVDFVASQRHYVDHLAPVWAALPDGARGSFLVRAGLAGHAQTRGVAPIEFRHDGELLGHLRRGGGPVVTAGHEDLKVVNRGGRPQILTEHGAGQSYAPYTHSAYAGGTDGRDGVKLFLAPNDYAAALHRVRYPGVPAEVVGCPKLDVRNQRSRAPDSPPVVAISFHWDCQVVPETRTAWPHFRNALPDLAQRYRVLGHGHPRIIDQLAPEYRRLGIEVVYDFEEVLAKADVYVCDNSSTLFEFAATGRPVVVLNAPWYRREVHHGLRFWDAADVGVQCDEPGALLSAIEDALSDPDARSRRREEIVARVYPVHDGTSSERAAKAIQAVVERMRARAGDLTQAVTDGQGVMITSVEMTTLRSFIGDVEIWTGAGWAVYQGMVRRGARIRVSESRSAEYQTSKLAARIEEPGPSEHKPAGPSEMKVQPAPAAPLGGGPGDGWPKHLGAGYFQLSNGEKIKGKEAAAAAEAQLGGGVGGSQ